MPVWQTMKKRGFRVSRQEIENALFELEKPQASALHQAAVAVPKGSDGPASFGLLEAFRLAAGAPLRETLRSQGIYWRADKLLALACDPATSNNFAVHCAQLRTDPAGVSAGEEVANALRELCGSLLERDLPHFGEAAGPNPSAAAPPAACGAARGGQLQCADLPPPPAAANSHRPRRRDGAPSDRSRFSEKGRADRGDRGGAGRQRRRRVVMIEGADSNGEADSGYNWADKIMFQVDLRELPTMLAMLLGWQDEGEFRFHGQKKDKTLRVEHQQQGLYVELRQTGCKLGVPVSEPDPICAWHAGARCHDAQRAGPGARWPRASGSAPAAPEAASATAAPAPTGLGV
jgi:hypothetical protein